jgi:hypothetical protein
MSILRLRWTPAAALAGFLMVAPTGCAVDGAGYGYDGGYAYGADYYGPVGDDYGAWGDGYYVGPYRGGGYYRGGDHGGDHGGWGGGHPGGHAFRGAPASRGIPSIPSGGHGGSGRAGGGHR